MRVHVNTPHLKDDEDVDPGEDEGRNGNLRLHVDVERLVGQGEGHDRAVLEESLHTHHHRPAAAPGGGVVILYLKLI